MKPEPLNENENKNDLVVEIETVNMIPVDFRWLALRFDQINKGMALSIEKDPENQLEKTRIEIAQFFGAMQIISEVFQKYAVKQTEKTEQNG